MKINQVDLLRDGTPMKQTLSRLFGDHVCSKECAIETRAKWRFGESDGLFLWHVGLRIAEYKWPWVKQELSDKLSREIAAWATKILFDVAEELGVNAQGWGARLLREGDTQFFRHLASIGHVTIVAVNPRQQIVAFPSERPAA